MTQPVTVRLNGVDTRIEQASLGALLARMGLSAGQRGIAVAINDEVVPRALWAETALNAGDRIEIVRLMQGG